MDGQSGGDTPGAAGARPGQAGEAGWPACGDFDMRIGPDGTWYYKGGPIGRKRLVKLFASVLRREADGTYWLVTPVERGRIEVEDVPFVAEEVTESGAGPGQILAFRTNLDEWVEAGPERPLRVEHAPETGEPRPYILVRPGLEARLSRSAFYHLVELAVDDRDEQGRDRTGVWSKGSFFPLDPPPR